MARASLAERFWTIVICWIEARPIKQSFYLNSCSKMQTSEGLQTSIGTTPAFSLQAIKLRRAGSFDGLMRRIALSGSARQSRSLAIVVGLAAVGEAASMTLLSF